MTMSVSTQLIKYRPPRIAMFLMIIAIAVHWLIPISVLPSSLMVATLAGVTGFSLMLRAWWLFKVSETAICPTAENTVLVTHDVFTISRNPMYLGMVLMLFGCAIYAGTLPFYFMATLYFVIINFAFCPYEEQKLQVSFGQEFLAYKSSVRRWL
jgi:protein-S-isoprenylcysteine O-methyltransferase Ste14